MTRGGETGCGLSEAANDAQNGLPGASNATARVGDGNVRHLE